MKKAYKQWGCSSLLCVLPVSTHGTNVNPGGPRMNCCAGRQLHHVVTGRHSLLTDHWMPTKNTWQTKLKFESMVIQTKALKVRGFFFLPEVINSDTNFVLKRFFSMLPSGSTGDCVSQWVFFFFFKDRLRKNEHRTPLKFFSIIANLVFSWLSWS